jgi:hypothetical protein
MNKGFVAPTAAAIEIHFQPLGLRLAVAYRYEHQKNDDKYSFHSRKITKYDFGKLPSVNTIEEIMVIGIAGPYSAETEEQRQKNLDAMNSAAAKLLELGHIPLIGVNAALPVVIKANVQDRYKSIMDISLAVMDACDALLLLAESPGAIKERDRMLSKGKLVFKSIEEIENYGL